MFLPSLLLTASLSSAQSVDDRVASTGPSLATRVEGSVGLGLPAGGPAAGVGLTAGLPFGRAEIEADLGIGADGLPSPRVTTLLGARVPLGRSHPDGHRGLALTGALGGGWWLGSPRPLARIGLSYDVPMARAPALRASLAWQAGGGGAGAIVAGLGAAWRIRPHSEPVPVVGASVTAPVPVPAAAPPSLSIVPPGALIWVPHPVCEWVTSDQLASMPNAIGLVLQVRAPGFLPVEVVLASGPLEIALQPAPAFGAVVVVASPGDRLSIGGKAFPISPDGTAVFGAAEGPLEVEVVGGGRRVVLDGAVAGGYALWLRAPTPAPLTVTFPPGSSVVPAEAEASIRAYADRLGDHPIRVVGSSAVGEPHETRALAVQRAEALAAALVAAGVPRASVKVLSSSRRDDEVGDQRSARIESLAVEAGP